MLQYMYIKKVMNLNMHQSCNQFLTFRKAIRISICVLPVGAVDTVGWGRLPNCFRKRETPVSAFAPTGIYLGLPWGCMVHSNLL